MQRETNVDLQNIRISDLMGAKWRVGRHRGRNVYAIVGEDGEARDEDVDIARFDHPEIAEYVVGLHNHFR